VLGTGVDPRVRKQVAAESALAVDVLGMGVVFHQRLTGSLIDGYRLCGPGQLEGVLCVLDLILKLDVTGTDCDPLELNPV
jgi:hypothetical protein